MSPTAQDRRLRELEKHYEQLSVRLTRFDLQAPPPEPSDAESDVLADLGGGPVATRFLGFYTLEGIRRALMLYGFVDALARRGYPDARLTMDLDDPFRHVLRVYDGPTDDPQSLLLDLRLRLIDEPEEAPLPATGDPKRQGYLVVEWLVLQSPKAQFDAQRGVVPLPGQRLPGLGVGSEVLALLERMAVRLGKRGIIAHPSWYHNAVMYRPRFRFADPRVQGRFDAILRDTAGFTLAEVSWATDLGCLDDLVAKQPFQWQGAEQLLPLVASDAAWLDSAKHRAASEVACESASFRLDEGRLARRLSELREQSKDEPIPTPDDLRRHGAVPGVRSVLVPTDLSESASAAFPVARTVAMAFGATVHVGHVIRASAPALPPGGPESPPDDVVRRLCEAAAALGPGVAVQTFTRRGMPATELLTATMICGFDMVVMARRARLTRVGLMIGATTERIVRECPAPVLVVPASMRTATAYDVRRILYPVDFSNFSIAGVPLVAEIARALHADLDVLHVFDMPEHVPLPRVGRRPPDRMDELFDEAELSRVFDNPIDRFFERLHRMAPDAAATLLRGPDVATTILEHARTTGANLIVMPAQGNGFVQRVLVGGVSSSVVDASPVPVLVLPPALWEG